MQEWKMRTREIAYLLNPAFCGRILYTTIRAYNEKSHRAFPFPLVYLVLPLVLHKETRAIISSRTHLHIWVQQNPQLLIDFPRRASELIPITNEAVEMLLQTRKIISEIAECLTKCAHIARWFEDAGKVENIYISLGVRP